MVSNDLISWMSIDRVIASLCVTDCRAMCYIILSMICFYDG